MGDEERFCGPAMVGRGFAWAHVNLDLYSPMRPRNACANRVPLCWPPCPSPRTQGSALCRRQQPRRTRQNNTRIWPTSDGDGGQELSASPSRQCPTDQSGPESDIQTKIEREMERTHSTAAAKAETMTHIPYLIFLMRSWMCRSNKRGKGPFDNEN